MDPFLYFDNFRYNCTTPNDGLMRPKHVVTTIIKIIKRNKRKVVALDSVVYHNNECSVADGMHFY
jgi:hypothetical protein